MEHDNLDKIIQDIKDSIDKIDTHRIEDFFMDNYTEKWIKLPNEKRQSVLKKIQDFIDCPKNKGEIRKAKEKMKNYENIKFNIGILFLGVLLGVSGSLVANLLDRYFVHFGFKYDIVVTIIFFFFLWHIYRTFIKKTENEIMTNKTISSFLAIINEFERESTNTNVNLPR